jgi:hypothetical protein
MMKRRLLRQSQVLTMLLLAVLATGGWKACGNNQPKTVADSLTALGNIKRNLKKGGEITAQQDLDISRKLDTANRSYRQFITDEQKRVAAGTPDPTARAKALSELRSIVTGLDAAAVGIKNPKSAQLWNESVATLNTILAGLGG